MTATIRVALCFNSRLREEATAGRDDGGRLAEVSTHASVRRRPASPWNTDMASCVSTHASVRRRPCELARSPSCAHSFNSRLREEATSSS